MTQRFRIFDQRRKLMKVMLINVQIVWKAATNCWAGESCLWQAASGRHAQWLQKAFKKFPLMTLIASGALIVIQRLLVFLISPWISRTLYCHLLPPLMFQNYDTVFDAITPKETSFYTYPTIDLSLYRIVRQARVWPPIKPYRLKFIASPVSHESVKLLIRRSGITQKKSRWGRITCSFWLSKPISNGLKKKHDRCWE